MNDKFDELAKGLAQSVTRRGALKKFGLGLAGITLACFGLANRAEAGFGHRGCVKKCENSCAKIYGKGTSDWYGCVAGCTASCPDGF